MKKLLPACFLLSGCYALEHYENYYDSRHRMELLDSTVVNGKLMYRVFKCQNDCGYYDTFPNPTTANYIEKQRENLYIDR